MATRTLFKVNHLVATSATAFGTEVKADIDATIVAAGETALDEPEISYSASSSNGIVTYSALILYYETLGG